MNGDAERHRCIIETPKYYKFFVAMVKNNESDGK